MELDQQYDDPTKRIPLQAKVWPYIQKNLDAIMSDLGPHNNGGYPTAPFAAWVLVQHMDAFPQNQDTFYKQLAKAIPNHPELQSLRDRADVNAWIQKYANDPKYYHDGKPLPDPTINVRNPNMFKDAGLKPTSREQALHNAKQAGNKLLVAAVLATDAQTQPSFTKTQESVQRASGTLTSKSVSESRMDILVESMLHNLQSQGLTEAQAVAHIDERLDEDLRKWFKQKWVRFGPDGRIRGACARGSEAEGKPKCLPQKKAWALGKKKRATAAARKRRQDPNPQREGKARMVATKESIDQQAGIGIDGQTFTFKIRDLVALAKEYPISQIDPAQFKSQLAGRQESPASALARAQKADLQYPIIVVKRKNGQLWIADGTHRVQKALMNNLAKISAHIIPVEDMTPFEKGSQSADRADTKESVGSTKLGDLCTIKTNFPDADFWLVRRGDRKNVGKPTKEFSPYHVGIKVTATEQLMPQYLYYMMMHLHNQGYWQTRSIGTTALLHIRTEDVKNIQLALTEHELKENSSCPHCGGHMVSHNLLNEKQDACYYKVKSRYKVWPSAYASGALVQCRKKGAKNWGNKGKK
jgi:hypothetical protein